uniref:ribonuclease H n=1 Tax=Pseudomonas phage RVTF4 TaxID=3236931 RepID=A0AB39CDA9_9VIRU
MDGIVLYTDGSFRQNKAGWGIHGYTYNNVAMSSKANTKQQPTAKGYKDVPASETVTVIDYIDAYGRVENNPTNNTAELSAAINAFDYAIKTESKSLTMLMDSEYVRKGLLNFVPKWQKNNWIKSDGNPVANVDYWKQLVELKTSWEEPKRKLELLWIKGHSNDMGNDKADANALLGGGHEAKAPPVEVKQAGEKINKLKKQPVNPLVMESRLLFGFNTGEEPDGYYYMYNLGRMHNYGHKPQDTPKDKLAKADLLVGRPISEATFGVYKAYEPDSYLEELIGLHAKAFPSDNPELGIINLANAYNANIRNNIETAGSDLLTKHDDILVMATGDYKLISRTLNPPRRANDAVMVFHQLQRQLDDYLTGKLGDGIETFDITADFFEQVSSGKKEIRQLLKSITQQTESVNPKIKFRGQEIELRLCLGLDIPTRNQLNRIGAGYTKAEVLVIAVGPMAYTYATVFMTDEGSAIYQSPYTQFILPK